MSPPAVSQQIRALEAHLGRNLFRRAAAGVTLTEAGRSLLVVVGEALGRMEAAAEALSKAEEPPLVIGVSLTLYAGWLAPRLPAFFDAHPDAHLQFRSIIGAVEMPPREATLWIAFGPPPPGTMSTHLFDEHLIPVAQRSVARSIRTAEDLKGHTLIEVSDHRRNWAQVLGVDVLPHNARILLADTTLAALSLASAGLGVALARPPASDDLVEKFGLVPCGGDMWLPGIEGYHIIANSGTKFTPDATAFQSWVIAQARNSAAN